MDIDFQEILSRALKYLFEGIAVGLACYFTAKLSMDEIFIKSFCAALYIFLFISIQKSITYLKQ